MAETVSWREHRVWLSALADTPPAELTSPLSVARWETEHFALDRPDTPSFRFVPDETMGESFVLERRDPDGIVIRGGETGLLYGTYEALFDFVCGEPLPTGLRSPACALRNAGRFRCGRVWTKW